MKQLSIMLKPASSLCNLRCRYCFYADITDLREVRSYGVMPPEKMREMLEKLEAQLAPGDRLTFAFQGGEPTLAGLPWFQEFTEITGRWDPDITVRYALQTNATLLTDDWCRYLAAHGYLVGVSLDLLPQCHDSARAAASPSWWWRPTAASFPATSTAWTSTGSAAFWRTPWRSSWEPPGPPPYRSRSPCRPSAAIAPTWGSVGGTASGCGGRSPAPGRSGSVATGNFWTPPVPPWRRLPASSGLWDHEK